MYAANWEQDDTLLDDSAHASVHAVRARIGCRVGAHHCIAQHLASGGMGHVFLAVDTLTGGLAAVKLLASDSPEMTARFLEECALLSRQHHPNIVRALESGVLHDGCPYLLMEHLTGVDLQCWLAANSQRSRPGILHVLRQLAAAIDHLHAQGILHRDIKPANVMLDPQRGYAIKLIDFGVAVREQGVAPRDRRLVGTPAYMAPEHAAGEACSRASDVYAIGALALEMLTGRPPFAYSSLSETLSALLLDPIELPSARGLRIGGLDACFERVLARDPAHRYATAGRFVAALEGVLSVPALSLSA